VKVGFNGYGRGKNGRWGEGTMNVVAGYGGMGPMGAVGDDLVVICGDLR
jgi:hypothetical protein